MQRWSGVIGLFACIATGATCSGHDRPAPVDSARSLDAAPFDATIVTDASPPDVSLPDATHQPIVRVTWQVWRSTPVSCIEANVANVEIVVRPVGVLFGSGAVVACEQHEVSTPVDPGDYEIDITPFNTDGAMRLATRTQPVTIMEDITVPFDLVFPAGGRMLFAWSIVRRGTVLPCSELSADTLRMSITGTVGTDHDFPCGDGTALSDEFPLGTYSFVDAIWMSTTVTPWITHALYRAGPVTLVEPEAVVYVPAVFELLDEPIDELQEIFDAAAAAYDASPDPKTFPPGSSEPSPHWATCCGPFSSGICAPTPGFWTEPPWTTLGFAVEDWHRFSYEYDSSGSGLSAVFTTKATADYDCDGVRRSYSLTGAVAPDGSVVGRDTFVYLDGD